jgi:hypothetical protein
LFETSVLIEILQQITKNQDVRKTLPACDIFLSSSLCIITLLFPMSVLCGADEMFHNSSAAEKNWISARRLLHSSHRRKPASLAWLLLKMLRGKIMPLHSIPVCADAIH